MSDVAQDASIETDSERSVSPESDRLPSSDVQECGTSTCACIHVHVRSQ